MKKNLFTLGLVIAGAVAVAQSPRLSLFEEFTGETCPPCAATNPGLNATLASPTNTSKVVAIKWQVPIPSAPTNTWSLWKTNQSEITFRYGATYGYQSQWSSTDPITNGVNSAPQGRIDGGHLWAVPGGGAANDHAGYGSNALFAAASSYTSPFSITMNRAWDPTFSTITVTANITASANYTSTGALVFRLVMIERHIHFPTQPGTNGEKDFEDVAIKSFPTTTSGTVTTSMGTAMVSGWVTGQTQQVVLTCPLPAYTRDKSEVAFVGFIQDDGNKKVQQAALANTVGLTNDAKAISANIGAVVCSTTLIPTATIKNIGTNAITAFTVSPTLDATTGADVVWTGNLAAGASTTIPLNLVNITAGSHTYSYNITSVSGGEFNMGNNKQFSVGFVCSPTYFPGPVQQAFASASPFPPTNFTRVNNDNGAATWIYNATSAYGVGTGSARYDFYDNSTIGDVDDLYLPPSDLTAMSAPVLGFDVAYTFYTAAPNNENDKLEVKASTDCGATWTTLFSQAGTALATAPVSTASFVPNASQWKSVLLPMTAYANSPNVLVKFSATSDYGNNMYVDNINLTQANPTAIKANAINEVSFDVYPNPTRGEANVNITAVAESKANLVVLNTLGQVVFSKQVDLNVGVNTIQLDASQFANGLYNVMVESKNGSMVKKLTITK